MLPILPVKAKANGILRSLVEAAEQRIVARTAQQVDDPEPQINDDANWLDLDAEEQIAFDQKLQVFLGCDAGNDRERQWLLPGS